MNNTLSNRPFFIVGAERSGTTMLRLMLNESQNVLVPRETWFMIELMNALPLENPLNKSEIQQAFQIIVNHSRWKDMEIESSELLSALPPRYTASDRLKDFPTELSQAKLATFQSGDLVADIVAIEDAFSAVLQDVCEIDYTDGIRIEYESQDIIHLRPSGNAPELRCYTESNSEAAAITLNKACLDIMAGWRN